MLLDTSGIFCTLDFTDPLRPKAIQLFARADERVVHSIILAEFMILAFQRGLRRDMAFRAMWNLLDDEAISKVWVDDQLMRKGLALLEQRPDKGYSLCDAVSFVLMRDRGISEALTLDHHFEQEGFQRLLTA